MIVTTPDHQTLAQTSGKLNTISFGNNPGVQTAFSVVLGEMPHYNVETTLGAETDRRDRSKNLHDESGMVKSPLEKSSRKKPLAIAHAGGAGGGIRQNAKVIKSKNAQSTGGPWNANNARIAEISSDLGNILNSDNEKVLIEKRIRKVPNIDDPHQE